MGRNGTPSLVVTLMCQLYRLSIQLTRSIWAFSGLPSWLHQPGSSSSLHPPVTSHSIQETGVTLQGTLQSSRKDSKWVTLVTTHWASAHLPSERTLRGITNSRRRNSPIAVWPGSPCLAC